MQLVPLVCTCYTVRFWFWSLLLSIVYQQFFFPIQAESYPICSTFKKIKKNSRLGSLIGDAVLLKTKITEGTLLPLLMNSGAICNMLQPFNCASLNDYKLQSSFIAFETRSFFQIYLKEKRIPSTTDFRYYVILKIMNMVYKLKEFKWQTKLERGVVARNDNNETWNTDAP